MKRTFISWTRYDRHSELCALHLGASMHFICEGQQGKALQAPLRYARQARLTWRLLNEEHPDVVFVQNPPIFSALLASLYARRQGARYVIDSHTGAFLSPKWRWSLAIHRHLSKGAVTTMVTNDHLKGIVNNWGCHAMLWGFTPGQYPGGEPFPLNGQFNVAVVCIFEDDEPLGEMLEAMGELPSVNFYVTGDHKRLSAGLIAGKPANCQFTGYLSYGQYISLLRGADVVLDLTTRDHTLLMGAYEAVSLGTPLIVSDWPLLRQYFHRGAVYVPNTVDGIVEGIRRAQLDCDTLRGEIVLLREQLEGDWKRQLIEIERMLEER